MTRNSFRHLAALAAIAAALCLGPMARAETADAGQGVIQATATAKPKGVFAFLAPKDPQARAEKRAKRKAEREAARAAGGAAPAADARAEVKAAVEVARANRPKGRLWCVPFARAVAGVDLRGNAKTWWKQAEGRYARGKTPAIGAIMSFAASRAMPQGHVAIVSHVVDDRTVLVDQANWERNRITEDTVVVDVSEKGDWSAVRVANSAGTLGRVNPVNGFIYN